MNFMIDDYNFDLIAFEFSVLKMILFVWDTIGVVFEIHWIDQMKTDLNVNDSTMIIIISVQCEPG